MFLSLHDKIKELEYSRPEKDDFSAVSHPSYGGSADIHVNGQSES